MQKKAKDIVITIDGEKLDFQEIIDFVDEDTFTLDSLDVIDLLDFIKDKLEEILPDSGAIEIRKY